MTVNCPFLVEFLKISTRLSTKEKNTCMICWYSRFNFCKSVEFLANFLENLDLVVEWEKKFDLKKVDNIDLSI